MNYSVISWMKSLRGLMPLQEMMKRVAWLRSHAI